MGWGILISILVFCVVISFMQTPKVMARVEGLKDVPDYKTLKIEIYEDKLLIDEQYSIPMVRILYADSLANLGCSGFTRGGRYSSTSRYFLRIHYRDLSGEKQSFTLTSDLNPTHREGKFTEYIRIHDKINRIKKYTPKPPKKVPKIEKEI